jgi:hypothetical protein
MYRRDVLRAGAGALALPVAARVTGATASQSLEPMGSVAIDGTKEAVVGDDGETVYAATTDGFAVVDVSDPASPEVLSQASRLLATRDGGPLRNIYDVKVDGDTLLAAGPASSTDVEDPLNGVAVYDVNDPQLPERTAFHETTFRIHNCYLADGVAYLTAGLETVIVDVSGDSPEELSRWRPEDADGDWGSLPQVGRSAHDLYVHENMLYIAHWDAGTWFVDVSDPANPEYVNRVGAYTVDDLEDKDMWTEVYEVPGNSHYVAVNDDASLLASGAEAWERTPDDGEENAPGGIDIWDISDPENPEKVSFVEAPPGENQSFGDNITTSHNFDFHGDHLYTSWYHGGVKVFDISDPANPEELAWWQAPDQSSFWTAQHASTGAFVAANNEGAGDYPTGVYTFPDPAAQGEDTTETTTTTATQTTTATTEQTTTATTTERTTTEPSTTSESTATTESTTTQSPETTATTDATTAGSGGSDGSGGGGGDGSGSSNGSTPGFGVLAAVSAVGGAALAAWRRAE